MSGVNWTTKQLAERGGGTSPTHKYNARKKVVDGIIFDSAKEARRYQVLSLHQKAGLISELRLQRRWLLQEKFRDLAGKAHREIVYVSDFDYMMAGKHVVEDTKGFKTQAYRIKAKMFRKSYPDVEFIES